MKHILVFFVSVCFPSKRSVPFRQKVRTFLHKSPYLFAQKYAPFVRIVRTFYVKSPLLFCREREVRRLNCSLISICDWF